MPHAEFDAFTWHPVGRVPKGYVVATAGLAIVCMLAGFYAGRLSAGPALAVKTAAPTTVNSTSVKRASNLFNMSKVQGQKNELDPAPQVVLLNPGTAAPTTDSPEGVASVNEQTQEVKNPAKHIFVQPTSPKVIERHNRKNPLRGPAHDYLALRQYVMGR